MWLPAVSNSPLLPTSFYYLNKKSFFHFLKLKFFNQAYAIQSLSKEISSTEKFNINVVNKNLSRSSFVKINMHFNLWNDKIFHLTII